MKKAPFHLSLPCLSISKTKEFYVHLLGAHLGRFASHWLDIDLFGNQITFTKAGDFNFVFKTYKFENSMLPAFHFGVILDKETWEKCYRRIAESEVKLTEKTLFLENKSGEHTSFFVQDPNGHTIEFKCFSEQEEMFKV